MMQTVSLVFWKRHAWKTSAIVNRIRMDMVRRGDMMSVDDVADILAVPVIGALSRTKKTLSSPPIRESRLSLQVYGGGGFLKYLSKDFRGIGSVYGSGSSQRDSGPHFRLFKEGVGGGADEKGI
ncbi:MAG: hypothetical protein V8S58_02490 [Lachnospiraceae bacterium]